MSKIDRAGLLARLEAVEHHLDGLAARPAPPGLSEPDPGQSERWDAGQIWAHMAEFVAYWQGQINAVVVGYRGEPVPFGRTKADPSRIGGIEAARHEPIGRLRQRVHASIEDVRRYLGGLTETQWNAVGRHVRRGDMDIAAMVEEFIVNHLEEHADQLAALR